MNLGFDQTCLLCDLPWKNNRVRYDGKLVLEAEPRRLKIGEEELTISADGDVRWRDQHIATDLRVNDTSIALDTLHKRLYFASENRMISYDLEEKCVGFTFAVKGRAGAPLLFEWLLPDGEICTAVSFSDGCERFIALERVTGKQLWSSHILGVPVDTAAHWQGYLYLTLAGFPCLTLCLEADTGDLVWWNRGKQAARGGVVCGDCYCVQYESGRWQRFSLIDGEMLT